MLKAVIFDMDGLLIDSEQFWRQAEIEVFASVGVHLTPSLCSHTMGLRIDEVVEYWYQRYPWDRVPKYKIADHIVSRVQQLIGQEGTAKTGVHELLSYLATQNVKIALASSSDYKLIDTVLDRLNIRSYFDVVYSATEEDYGKPHPGVYLTTAKKIDIPPTCCLALEDSITGVLAAKSARMSCIAVPEGYPSYDPQFVIADHIVGSLLDIQPEQWLALRGGS